MTFTRVTLFAAALALFVAVLAPPAPVFAQDVQSSTCAFTYSSGPLATFTRYCLSGNGNIVQFDSPSGFEYINHANLLEGYGICDVSPNIAYFDYASTDSGNWGATTVTMINATTREFVRATIDGVWQLTQTIKQGKANAKGPGTVTITMALKNLSTISRNVTLLRIANVDNGPVTTNDQFVSSFNSAWGSEPGASWGLGVTTNTFSFAHNGAVFNVPTGPDPCHYVTHIINFAFVGDGSLGHVYAITVPAGATKTVTLTYKPI